jgi:hypothetical protein
VTRHQTQAKQALRNGSTSPASCAPIADSLDITHQSTIPTPVVRFAPASRKTTLRPYLRILFIMVMSYIVVLVGSAAVADTTVPFADRDRFWLVLFALMAVGTVLAARLFRRNDKR